MKYSLSLFYIEGYSYGFILITGRRWRLVMKSSRSWRKNGNHSTRRSIVWREK